MAKQIARAMAFAMTGCYVRDMAHSTKYYLPRPSQ
jgi:hypothetical protein